MFVYSMVHYYINLHAYTCIRRTLEDIPEVDPIRVFEIRLTSMIMRSIPSGNLLNAFIYRVSK